MEETRLVSCGRQKKSLDYQNGRQSFIVGDYSNPEFGNIKKWRIDEKIDGMNIRILFMQVSGQRAIPSIMGRTAVSQIPPNLLNYLQTLATWEIFDKIFRDPKSNSFEVCLFGEGYGSNIQATGKNYRKDPGFILFDILVDNWWFEKGEVEKISYLMGVPTAPNIGIMTEGEILEFVKSKPMSLCSNTSQVMEGIIARSEPLMLFRNRNPIMWKLKCKEFN